MVEINVCPNDRLACPQHSRTNRQYRSISYFLRFLSEISISYHVLFSRVYKKIFDGWCTRLPSFNQLNLAIAQEIV